MAVCISKTSRFCSTVLEVCLFAEESVVQNLVDSIKNGKSRQWLENPTCFVPEKCIVLIFLVL